MEALRDTGTIMTMVSRQLVHAEQMVMNTFHQVIVADNQDSYFPVALVPF